MMWLNLRLVVVLFLSISSGPLLCSGNLQGHVGEDVDWPAVIVSTEGSPWPLPQSMQTGSDVYALSDSVFHFNYAGATACPIIDQAFLRYYDIIFYGQPLQQAKQKPRYWAHMKRKASKLGASALLPGLTVAETDCSEMYPSLESSENYTLTVNSAMATLKAPSVWGVLRGLETFSQLVYDSKTGGLVVNSTTINDFPRFPHRGFLIDTSRHFLHIKYIFQMIDALAYNRMNVLHWHIVDYQSFPYESKTFPIMSEQGAFSPLHVYTQDDVAAVIAYARDRGVRVMPEFDTPGHATSWGSIKDFLTPCYSGGKPDGTTGPVNPILNSTYDFLGKFFKEIQDVFPDNYVHVGGDEVSFTCWQSNPNITAFMKQMGFGTDYAKLEEYYMKNLLDLLNPLKVQSIVWQEVVDNGVKITQETVVGVWKPGWKTEMGKVTKLGYKTLLSTPWYLNYAPDPYLQDWKFYYGVEPLNFNAQETVVEVWKPGWETEMGKVTKLGYKTLLSNPWYLNHGQDPYSQDWKSYYGVEPLNFNAQETVVEVWKGGWEAEMGKVTKMGYKTLLSTPWYLNYVQSPYSQDWKSYYGVEPLNFEGSAAQKQLVMGGEACMWAEYVDATNIIQRTWPRASTVAERLWSASTVRDIGAATPRIVEQRCRMIRRGLQAEPVTGPGFCKYEYDF